MATLSNIHPLVDEFGRVKAEIDALEARAQVLRAELIAVGHDAIEGDVYRVAISKTTRAVLDLKAMREKLEALGVSHQWFNAHTRHTSVTTVRCSARTGAAEAA